MFVSSTSAFEDRAQLDFWTSPPESTGTSASSTDAVSKFQSHELRAADVIPNSIRSLWYTLQSSGIPDDVFTQLVAQSAYLREKRSLTDISAKSLRDFASFWRFVGDAARPDLSITPKGQISLEWFKDPDHALGVLFPGSGRAIFSLFDAEAGAEGAEPADRFQELVNMLSARNENPFQWSYA
jgi:hypothetical protein